MFQHLPSTLVHETVVEVAEQDQVAEPGLTAAAPELDVVRICPTHVTITTRPPAAAIPRLQRPPCRRRDHARRTPDVGISLPINARRDVPYPRSADAAASQHRRCPFTLSSRLKRTTTIVGVGAAIASAIAGSSPERSVTGL